MLCDACLKISPSLEPVRQGTLKYENPWPSLVENLDKDSQDPLSRLLRASLAESNLDREIPNSQILVPGDLDMELQPSLDDLRKSADLGCEGCLFWLELVPEDIQDRLDVGVRIKAPSEPFFRTKIDPRDWSVGRLSFIGPNLESTNTDDDKIVDLATRSLEICVAEG
jgi:hypothetical protein